MTNNSGHSPLEHSERMSRLGVHVRPSHIWTSSEATANFISAQRPGARVLVIGEPCLSEALTEVGCATGDWDPDFVVVGETSHLSYDRLTLAVRAVQAGSFLLGTNPEPTGPTQEGDHPGTGSLCAYLERATGRTAYFVGKPNSFMLTSALQRLGEPIRQVVVVGDRMETDVRMGVEGGASTVFVLSGVGTRADAERYPFSPTRIVESVAQLVDELE
jgi:NagD protein